MLSHYGKDLAGDVELNGLLVEVKRRKNGTGFASLYKWLEQDDAQMLICRADAKKRLYVIPEEVMIQFVKDMGWMLGFKATKTEIEEKKMNEVIDLGLMSEGSSEYIRFKPSVNAWIADGDEIKLEDVLLDPSTLKVGWGKITEGQAPEWTWDEKLGKKSPFPFPRS